MRFKTLGFACGAMSHAKSLLHWSVIHHQVTFERQSGRGSEMPIYSNVPVYSIAIYLSRNTRFPTKCGIFTSKGVDSDKPVQPPFKLRNSKCCLFRSLPIIENSRN